MEKLYAIISKLTWKPRPGREGGRPPKVTPAKAAILAVIKEYHREIPYRELAATKYVEWLGIRGVHYTTIQKAIASLPDGLLEEAARTLAELVSSGDMDCVVDSANFSIREYETRMVGMRRQRTRETVKLVLLWDASKHVCHAISCISGEAHESRTLPRLVDSVRTWIRKLFADRGFSSRDNVQHLADLGIEPVIRPNENTTPRPKGKPAWAEYIRRFKEFGYEGWKDETGYGKRFPEEQWIAALVNRFKDEIRAKSKHAISKLL